MTKVPFFRYFRSITFVNHASLWTILEKYARFSRNIFNATSSKLYIFTQPINNCHLFLASVALTARVTRIQLSEWANSLTEALQLTTQVDKEEHPQVRKIDLWVIKGIRASLHHFKVKTETVSPQIIRCTFPFWTQMEFEHLKHYLYTYFKD